MGYATYHLEDFAPDNEDWLKKHGETIPVDPSVGRGEVEWGGGMLVTSDPTLFALSYQAWWAKTVNRCRRMKRFQYHYRRGG